MANLWAFLYQTLTLSVTAAVLLIAKRLFLDKLSPRWQYGVWAVFALRALIPAGLWGRVLVPGGRTLLEAARLAAERGLGSALTAPYAAVEVQAPVPLFPRGLPAPGSVTDALFYLYAAGILALGLWFFLSYLRLRRRVGRGMAPAPEAVEQIRAVAARYGLKVPARITVLPGLESAFVCGPLRPVLVLPDRPVDDKVILHELLHLKHGDLWAGVFLCALRCLHWCNPLAWYCCDRIQNDCEALCDQRALERLEGEDRREYGRILLDMADDRYARAPGTTSMANGGKNIKARISSIARFKRYPAGMALASACVAAVLAFTCLGGVSGAASAAVPFAQDRGRLALARAVINRPDTVAGALDTYAKALLCDSPLYYAMVLPEEQRAAAWDAALEPYEDDDLYSSPLRGLGYSWSRPGWNAEWSVMNLLADGAGGYTGTLFFTPLDRDADGARGLVLQEVAVRPDGAFWTVEPLEAPRVEARTDWWLCPSGDMPYTTYTGEAGGLEVEVDFQLRLAVNNLVAVNTSALFGWSSWEDVDHTPKPHAEFDWMRDGVAVRLTDPDSGAAVALDVDVAPMEAGGDPEEALAEADYRFTVAPGTLDEDPIQVSSGVYAGENMTLRAMPEAMAVSFAGWERTYTCIAYPTEVRP